MPGPAEDLRESLVQCRHEGLVNPGPFANTSVCLEEFRLRIQLRSEHAELVNFNGYVFEAG